LFSDPLCRIYGSSKYRISWMYGKSFHFGNRRPNFLRFHPPISTLLRVHCVILPHVIDVF
jgi:uncharacterized membrane protein